MPVFSPRCFTKFHVFFAKKNQIFRILWTSTRFQNIIYLFYGTSESEERDWKIEEHERGIGARPVREARHRGQELLQRLDPALVVPAKQNLKVCGFYPKFSGFSYKEQKKNKVKHWNNFSKLHSRLGVVSGYLIYRWASCEMAFYVKCITYLCVCFGSVLLRIVHRCDSHSLHHSPHHSHHHSRAYSYLLPIHT